MKLALTAYVFSFHENNWMEWFTSRDLARMFYRLKIEIFIKDRNIDSQQIIFGHVYWWNGEIPFFMSVTSIFSIFNPIFNDFSILIFRVKQMTKSYWLRNSMHILEIYQIENESRTSTFQDSRQKNQKTYFSVYELKNCE